MTFPIPLEQQLQEKFESLAFIINLGNVWNSFLEKVEQSIMPETRENRLPNASKYILKKKWDNPH